MNLKEKVKKLPLTPGVYLMKDAYGQVIYIGKAKKLKTRVSSYFQNSKAHSPKVKKLISTLKDFDVYLTDTEFEAFMLECQLIKEIQPYFNRKMKNPQAYAYIKVASKNGKRRIGMTYSPITDGNLIFGPYNNRNSIEKALEQFKLTFKINCNQSSNNSLPCLNHSLGLCLGMCLGGTALEEYNKVVDQLILLLCNKDRSLIENITEKMIDSAEQLDFKTAANYRDCLQALNTLVYKGSAIEFAAENKNILISETLDDKTVRLFLLKGNKILFSDKLSINPVRTSRYNIMKGDILSCLVSEKTAPPMVLGKEDLDEAQIIYSYLMSSQCCYTVIPEDATGASIDQVFRELKILKP